MGSINPGIDLRRDGEAAVITTDNPPVNALDITEFSKPSQAPRLLTSG
jgi:hypothetical protein